MRTIERGEVWRKTGPVDWARVERVMLPGYPEYDGGAPGVSVRFSEWRRRGDGTRWGRTTWFVLCRSAEHFDELMLRAFRYREGSGITSSQEARARYEAMTRERQAQS